MKYIEIFPKFYIFLFMWNTGEHLNEPYCYRGSITVFPAAVFTIPRKVLILSVRVVSEFEVCWISSFSLICDAGSFGGGALLSVQGSGFDPHNSSVLICGEECEVHREMSTSSRLYCRSPFNNGKYDRFSNDGWFMLGNFSYPLSKAGGRV